jgi:mRNA-degrading endonuclease toxin of MazEF toxin-antitoxin module
VKRGEIWWAELPAPVGSRPVVILTRNVVLHSMQGVVVGLMEVRDAGKIDELNQAIKASLEIP